MKKLRGFKFDRKKRPNRKYDWAKILNGEIWHLRKGTDFTIEDESMRAQAHVNAREKGVKVRTSIVDDGLVVQAYVPE